MNSSDPRTGPAVVRRDRARKRLRAVTAGTAALGLAVAGGLAFALPGTTHATASPAGTSARTSTGSSSGATSGGASGQGSSSASAPSSSSRSAGVTSGGS